MILDSAHIAIEYEYQGTRCRLVGRRDYNTGRLAPPTQADYDALTKGPGLHGMSPSEWSTWSRGLTSPVRWVVQL